MYIGRHVRVWKMMVEVEAKHLLSVVGLFGDRHQVSELIISGSLAQALELAAIFIDEFARRSLLYYAPLIHDQDFLAWHDRLNRQPTAILPCTTLTRSR